MKIRVLALAIGLGSCGTDPVAKNRPSQADLQPVQPPEHMANGWWEWPSNGPSPSLKVLEIDFTLHSDPGSFSDQHGLYLMLCYSQLADVDYYFGLQTQVHDPARGGRGKGLIFSRWKTRDLSNTRATPEGWTESSGHEGDFVGVRHPYDWGAGDYQVRLAPDGTPADGQWFGIWITDKDRSVSTWAGSLKFPNADPAPPPSVYTAVEVYGGPPIRPIDIPEWHVSLGKPSLNGVHPVAFTSNYSPFTGGILNSNVRYNSADETLHFHVGGSTQRTDPEQKFTFE